MNPFDPLQALRVMTSHGVRFVVIGGIAGRLWGSPSVTNDLDVCHHDTPENLTALSSALHELGARLRGVDEEVVWSPTPEALASAQSFTLVTTAGNLDLLVRPAGTDGFTEIIATASQMEIGGFKVAIADIEDLIRMKRAAGRPKDLIEVEVLGAVLDELDR
jgi:predicted nucleotidyltransferase